MSKVVFEVTGMRYHVECFERGRWVLVGRRSLLDRAIEAATAGCEGRLAATATWGKRKILLTLFQTPPALLRTGRNR